MIKSVPGDSENIDPTNAIIGASQERLMGIIGFATDAIIRVDNQQKISLFNATAEWE